MADRISFDSVLDMAQGLPGAIVDREVFLRETLGKRCDSCQVEDAIRGNPARAGQKHFRGQEKGRKRARRIRGIRVCLSGSVEDSHHSD